jgi:hypothetical protein
LNWYYWVPIIIFFTVVILNLVFIPYLWFAFSQMLIPAFPSTVVELLYISSIILLIIAGIIYWIGKRR